MKRRLLKDFLLPMSLPLAAPFFACMLSSCSDSGNDVAGGPGSITTNGIVACVGGTAVPNARVSLRKVDYEAPEADEEFLIVGNADVVTDSEGRFDVDVPDQGEFRLTVAHDGIAFSRIVSTESYAKLDSVELEATATVTGVADVPEGSKSIWVGVMGTDVLVRSDSNGVFVIPAMPANDSLQLYFMDEDYGVELERQSVFVAPYEQVLCNYKTPVAIDTVERRDSVEVPADTTPKVTVLLQSGEPAAYATIALRASDAKVGNASVRNAMVVADMHADENGQFVMEWPESGEYRLTVTSAGLSYSGIYAAEDLPVEGTLTLRPSVKISSNVSLKSDEEFAWVGVYGLDEFVKTDASGAYVLPTLPANDSLGIYFVHKDSSGIFAELNVRTAEKDSSFKPSMLLFDFEEDSENWYMSVDTLWKGSTYYTNAGKNDTDHLMKNHLQLDSARGSMVFHAKYHVAFDPYAWVLLGTRLEETLNLSLLDSIEFYAKGNGDIRLTLENWENYEKATKAASDWVALDSVWTRYVFTPDDLCINGLEKKDCKAAWGTVKGDVKQIHIFPNSGNEFYVDDIKLYGALY